MRHKLVLAGLAASAAPMLHAALPTHAAKGMTPPVLLAGVILLGVFLALILAIVVVLALLGARERRRRTGLIELARTQLSITGPCGRVSGWASHSNQELLDNAGVWESMAQWYRESTGLELDPRPPMPPDEALQVDDGHDGPKMGAPGAHGAA